MLEDDKIRNLVMDGLFRKKMSVTEFIHKLRYEMKEDINESYIRGYEEGYSKAQTELGYPPYYNPNL